ncbi:MarR family winged helix-turn-helix transcriptional regulator [Glycomyces terrestris]|uniref:MarR family transcriptional regulator n=1 Tax=Glycomyces terrestris TaxID=2493553 RepID=A0A426UW40_9ACTN|nr:MarR family winged helix-turn-helix transcriptional regulator [Glycomyces terrestris]RRR98555.1 MarR family transcriptional regulator [Glycomyces terrestris]
MEPSRHALSSSGSDVCDNEHGVGDIGHALFRVARAHRAAAGRILREIGLYPGQEVMLGRLADHGDTRQSRLVLELGIDPSTVTKMLQRLERQGLVERREDPVDRRVSVVAITASGRELLDSIEDSWRRLDEITCAGFEADDRDRLASLLGRLEDNLSDRHG